MATPLNPFLKQVTLTPQEEAYVRQFYRVKKSKDIAKDINVTVGKLYKNLRIMDLYNVKGGRLVADKEFFDIDHYAATLVTI